ncbi:MULTISPECIES: N-acetyltransferase [Bifidobacterium]|uniref:GNAT family N-acetyltransferase n=1 Tax=Bifidobacterium TaxID=1678 RepID=UPI0030840D63
MRLAAVCHRSRTIMRGTPAPILGFCEFGYDPASPQASDYAISFIATALSERGRHLGAVLLDCVLRWMANDAARNNREPYVLTQIDPRNTASIRLFSDLGFEDEGQTGTIRSTTSGRRRSRQWQRIACTCTLLSK